MKDTIKIIGVLTLVCVICAFFLSFIFALAREKIEGNNNKIQQEAIYRLAPSAEKVTEVKAGNDVIYKLFDNKGDLIGYVFLAEGQGYQGKIKILAAVNPCFDEMKGIEIIDSVETPGLGDKIQGEAFKRQFNNLIISLPIEYVKDVPNKDNQIRAITGATVSSRAVVNILNDKINQLRERLLEK